MLNGCEVLNLLTSTGTQQLVTAFATLPRPNNNFFDNGALRQIECE
jgi:hypothetical protein